MGVVETPGELVHRDLVLLFELAVPVGEVVILFVYAVDFGEIPDVPNDPQSPHINWSLATVKVPFACDRLVDIDPHLSQPRVDFKTSAVHGHTYCVFIFVTVTKTSSFFDAWIATAQRGRSERRERRPTILGA